MAPNTVSDSGESTSGVRPSRLPLQVKPGPQGLNAGTTPGHHAEGEAMLDERVRKLEFQLARLSEWAKKAHRKLQAAHDDNAALRLRVSEQDNTIRSLEAEVDRLRILGRPASNRHQAAADDFLKRFVTG